MKDDLFQQLASSLREGADILHRRKEPARTTTLEWPDARAVREKLGLSQSPPKNMKKRCKELATLRSWSS